MDMRTARKSANTYQYECPECGLKYAVGEQIVTGTMTPELLRSRGGRRSGYCHCGHRFASEFFDKKNPMWRLPIGKKGRGNKGAEPATAVYPLRTLPRVSSGAIQESEHFTRLRESMSEDLLFADSVLATAELAARTMASSALRTKRKEGRRRMKPILEARRSLEPRLAAIRDAASEEVVEPMLTRYTPSLEGTLPTKVAEEEAMGVSS